MFKGLLEIITNKRKRRETGKEERGTERHRRRTVEK